MEISIYLSIYLCQTFSLSIYLFIVRLLFLYFSIQIVLFIESKSILLSETKSMDGKFVLFHILKN